MQKAKALQEFLGRFGAGSLVLPGPAGEVEIIQTHLSVVLLNSQFAYKIKKPVKFPFVDYSNLEKRKAFCLLELELNRRLTPDVYLGVVPFTLNQKKLEAEGPGEPVEYAVKMLRLPEEQRLDHLLQSGTLPKEFWKKLSSRLCAFYQEVGQGPEISTWAKPEAIEEDWFQVLSQIDALPEVAPELKERLRASATHALKQHRTGLQARVNYAREGHGDLRLEHIYCFPENKISIIDCVEFNPRYRCGDPMLDVAFLSADMEATAFRQESRIFLKSFLAEYGHAGSEFSGLLDFYLAYRHLVRGMVRGLQAQEEDLDDMVRKAAGAKSKLHLLQALAKLAESGGRPSLLLLSGLPGTGKTSLAGFLGEKDGFSVFSSDILRKELAGVPSDQPKPVAPLAYEEGLYNAEWTQKTYAALLGLAEEALSQGKRVLIDASFWKQARREPFEALAKSLGLPFLFVICEAEREQVLPRLSSREPSASDADENVYLRMAEAWEPPSESMRAIRVDTGLPIEESLRKLRNEISLKEKEPS
jgi:aminoglycoside phosphotransferase family enzyme/predicted kinase